MSAAGHPEAPTGEALPEDWQAGTIARLAGTGEAGYAGDGGAARSARLNGPAGLAVDEQGNVFIAELRNHAIRRVDAVTGLISTVAGSGERGFAGDGGPATAARLNAPEGVAVDRAGNLYIADSGNQRVRRVDARTGVISTIAGTGETGRELAAGPALATRLNHPSGVAVDSVGNVYFNDYANDVIRRIDTGGRLTVWAGTGRAGFAGDGGPAVRAEINDVYGLCLDRTGALYFVDSLNFRVRRVDARDGLISTVVGDGQPGPVVEFASVAAVRLGGKAHVKGTIGSAVAHGVDVDAAGNVFVADTGAHRIRMLHHASQRFFTVAGSGEGGAAVEGARALASPLETHGVRVGVDGSVYSVDFVHHVVHVVRFPATKRETSVE